MIHTAYNLNPEFVEELRQRIQQLVETATPTTIFGNIFLEIESIPSPELITKMIDAALVTSFATDEGNAVTVSIILNPEDDAFDTFRFDNPIVFDVRNLVKLGASLENPRADVAIWPDEHGNLSIWGFKTRSVNTVIANLCVEAIGPGRVLITFGGKSLAALIENEGVFIDHSHFMSKFIPKLSSSGDQQNNKMLRIMRYLSLLITARRMREHGRGGTLLVVSESMEWRNSIGTPLPYTGGANFLESDYDIAQKPSLMTTVTDFFGALIKNKTINERENLQRLGDEVEQQCRRIAKLTAVDGALAMSRDRFVYCFGAKIILAKDQIPPTELRVYRPVEGDEGVTMSLMDLGGTRHQSAAQFAHGQPDSVAIVVSQDGDVTFITTEKETEELVAIQLAELAVIPEGLGAALWRYSQLMEMDLL